MLTYNVPKELNNTRLDKALSLLLKKVSRNQVQKAIKNYCVQVNGVIISDSDVLVKENDTILFSFKEPEELKITAANITLDIIYEDDDLIVINKAAGMTVHPGIRHHDNTLVNALLHHTKYLSDIGSAERPGIVHRLDKDTTGLMVVAKNNKTHILLANQIKQRQVIRKYKALVWGVINPLEGIIKNNVGRNRNNRKKMTILKYGGKKAVTYYKTLELFYGGTLSMVECKLSTGRTHQIRVQLSNLKHSVVGDQTYGNNNRKIINSPPKLKAKLIAFKRQALHSWYLSFTHPTSNDIMAFSCELPRDMQEIITD
ncbi:RluA family pseudouridine synthase [Rickettsia prowazekii]|uniref:Pseudouridine synthase n=2 Tax=Rickettsia prowazekii TaxID=782 RepID=Q9ZCB4_RICPR|nr:RluA family pseudouridine synthase [Rickettsia prowazekii]EOB10221.1 Pseudouridine synthase [Rickettsia prowazekii str. GvF12]ADE30422.1 Ribosomal large subunit pseudouridine synthases RluD subfamily protein [Rickettsia prowazekii str. Rp22]AFE49640.1 pseudouridylate synthase [Rickettsia prowazekii str. Chernikova]AFE50484.1 pseudouridylate synthase [Rickettsia prowazekii str. Katsinyian]AFE51327.1 pseudouridylate synthase [Rickettsia prowazekii str. BuV67-CWPP]